MKSRGVSKLSMLSHDLGVEVLYLRLLEAEAAAQNVSRELGRVLEQLLSHSQNLTLPGPRTQSHNLTQPGNHSLTQPGNQTAGSSNTSTPGDMLSVVGGARLQIDAHFYLPHLSLNEDSLTPNVVLGGARTGVSMVLGVPTVRRVKQNYLINTLSSLLYNLTPQQRRDMVIVIFVAETDSLYVSSVADTISKNFPREVLSGLLEVVSPSPYFYPNLTNLPETFGDSKDRVKWRTKQNLDYSFLMLYVQNKGLYYVQLEDDIVAKADYFSTMTNYVTQHASGPWLFLEFSQLGFIGKVFRTRDLPMVAQFFLMFHRDKPIDWLLDHILWVKACNPEKDVKDCTNQKARLKLRYKPSLFQHVGLHSSLAGKVQPLKDKDFGKQSLFQPHPNNPTAQLDSTMTHYLQHSLDRAYRGLDFYWALSPLRGDHLLVRFTQPAHVTGYVFRSGNIETHADRFYNTTLEVLPSNSSVRLQLVGGPTPRYAVMQDGFIVVGEFVNGVCEGHIEASLRPLSALRLKVHSDSDVWALLSEIYIKV